jgi:hypothetical protein
MEQRLESIIFNPGTFMNIYEFSTKMCYRV